MNKIKVENSSSLYRDQESGAILNCSDTEYNAYLDLKKRRMVELSDLETQKKDIDNLKNEINEVKDLLKQVLTKL
jgi:hypothetical protein|tara:strand:+ start:647 stop:871 length:225 start_codon:yes stop_codon:yes gene_type:complete